jgi:hypothetical protein
MWKWINSVALFILYFILLSCYKCEKIEPVATFPLQLSCDIEIEAHLIPENNDYPPRRRRMSIAYDYTRKRARVDIEEGYEAAKTYYRLYGDKIEYMVRHPPISDCKRSYLGDIMPFPVIPESTFIGETTTGGIECYHFMHIDFEQETHMFMDRVSGAPVQLEHWANVDDTLSKMLTYRYTNVKLGEPAEEKFELSEPFSHGDCENQIGGWPYQHVFHYFVRF